ncbi:MAG: flagellar motor switch protein FliN [Myxococcota bacterium]
MADENGAITPASPITTSLAGGLGAFDMLRDVEVEVTLEIGRKTMKIADVLRLHPGDTVELTKAAGDPIDIFVNGQLLGRGEAVVVGDRYGVRITELVAAAPETPA